MWKWNKVRKMPRNCVTDVTTLMLLRWHQRVCQCEKHVRHQILDLCLRLWYWALVPRFIKHRCSEPISVPTSSYSSFTPGRPWRCPRSFLTTRRIPTSLILSWRRLMSTAPLQRSETSTTPSLRSWINFRFFTVGQAEVKVCYKKHIFCFLLNIISLCV